MANITITDIDNGSVLVDQDSAEFEDHVITVGGAVTLAAGTILARNTSTLKFVPFVIGGETAGNGVPGAVLTYPVASSGAGDVAARILIAGKVKKERLIEDGDGDASNLTAAHYDDLREVGIIPVSTKQLGEYDNS